MDIASGKGIKKRLGELLVEYGIVPAEEMPKGLEYAQKANDSDIYNVGQAKQLIAEKRLDVSLAIKAINLAKHKKCTIEDSLMELGWRPLTELPPAVAPAPGAAKATTTSFDRSELDAIGRKQAAAAAAALPTAPAQAPTASPGAVQSTFDAAELDAIKPSGNLARKSLWGLKAITASHAASGNPMAALGSMQAPAAVSPAAAGKKNAEELISEGDHAFERHNFELAETRYVEALNVLECSPDSTLKEVSDLLVKTGSTCTQIKEFARAEQYFCRAMRIRELHAGPEDIGVAECLDNLAELFDAQSQFLQAEQYYLSALGIKEKMLSTGSSEVAASLKKLVAVSKRKGLQPEEKLSGQLLTEAGLLDAHTLEEGLNLARQSGVPIGRALVSLNVLNEQDLESVVQAQLLLREGVVPGYVAVRALRSSSQKRVPLRQALQEIGLNPEEACSPAVFKLLDTAQQLVAAERTLMPDDPGIATLCATLGDLYMQHHRYKEAEQLFTRAASVAQKSSTADFKPIVEALTRLGMLHYSTGQYKQADEMLTKVLALFNKELDEPSPESEAHLEPVHALAAESLAAVRYVLQQYEQAGQLYQTALDLKQQLLGAEHPELAVTLQGRAHCYFAGGQHAQAEQLYRRALKITQQTYGEQSEHTAAISSVLGDVLFAQRQYVNAQEEYLRCMDAISNAANPDLTLFCSVLEKLARACAEQNDLPKAEAYYRHLIKTRHNCGMQTGPEMADALERHAAVLDNMGRQDEAAVSRQKAQVARGA